MDVFEIKSTKDKLIITVDRSSVDAEFLTNFLNRLRAEQLIRKAKFDNKILQLSKTIKRNWWKKTNGDF